MWLTSEGICSSSLEKAISTLCPLFHQLAGAWEEHISCELLSAVRGDGEDGSPAKAWDALHQLNERCAEMGMPDYAEVEHGDGMAALEVAHAMIMEAWGKREG